MEENKVSFQSYRSKLKQWKKLLKRREVIEKVLTFASIVIALITMKTYVTNTFDTYENTIWGLVVLAFGVSILFVKLIEINNKKRGTGGNDRYDET